MEKKIYESLNKPKNKIKINENMNYYIKWMKKNLI